MLESAINGVKVFFSSALYKYAGVRFPGNVFGWSDLRGHFVVPGSGTTAGTREQFKTGVYALGFNASDILDWGFHLDHSEVVGGDKFLHLHVKMSDGTVASGNNLVITAACGYSRHNRTGSPAAFTKTITITPAELNSAANGTLVPTETLIGQTGGGTGLLDSSINWVTDDDLAVTLAITQIPTLTGGLHQKIGIPHVDIHREVLWGGTPRRTISNGSFFNG